MDDWVEEWGKSIPTGDQAAVVQWYAAQWPVMIAHVKQLNARFHAARVAALEAALPGAVLDDLAAREELGEDVAADQAAAQRSFGAATLADAIRDAGQRTSWVHSGERPCQAFTRALRPPHRPSDKVAGVRHPISQLIVSGPAEVAAIMAKYSAGISARLSDEAREAAAPARAAVAEAVAFYDVQGRISAAEKAALEGVGQQITDAQVLQAIQSSASGTAPGPDGITIALYRRHRDVFAPILSAVFTGMLRSGQLPPGLHEGVLTYIYKDGDRAQPSNYRPITLLNTSYRLLAKALADALNPVMASLVSGGQTAFIRGRHIGDTVLGIQTAAALLGSRGHWAVAVFADFRKAYDTIDREFLFDTMAQMGVPAAFVAAARLLLTETRAAAWLNGHSSCLELFEAGIRQGCPLAPLLYLFVAEALLCMLRRAGVGVSFSGTGVASAATPLPGGVSVVAHQFADDTTPLEHGGPGGGMTRPAARAQLHALSDRLDGLRRCLDTFGRASGQCLNPQKTHLLPIGHLPAHLAELAPLGSQLAGFRVVNEAATLGATFEQGPGGVTRVGDLGLAAPPAPLSSDDEARLARVEATMARLGTMRPTLSLFGRSLGSGAYGVSQMLYHLEFQRLPSAAVTQRLNAAVALACRGGKQRKRYDIAHALLVGRPAEGGAGAMAWWEHTGARHACWAARALRPAAGAVWVTLFRYLLHDLHPALLPLGLFRLPTEGAACGATVSAQLACWGEVTSDADRLLPEVVARLAGGARALPPLSAIRVRGEAGRGAAEELGWALPRAQGAPQVVHLLKTQTPPDIARRDVKVACMCQRPPAPAPPAPGGKLASQPERPPPVPKCTTLTVAAGTALQLAAREANTPLGGRVQRWAQFLQVCYGGYCDRERPVGTAATGPRPLVAAPESLDEARAEVGPCFQRVWSLRVPNALKEGFWRLVYNGVGTAARLHCAWPCPCGAPLVAGRPHTFWDCVVAKAVIHEIEAALPPSCVLLRHHVWVLAPPARGINPKLWAAICVAALHGIARGRCSMVSQLLTSVEAAAGRPQGSPREAEAAASDSASERSGGHFDPLSGCPTGPGSAAASEAGSEAGFPFSPFVETARRLAVAEFYAALAVVAAAYPRVSGKGMKFSAEQEASHPLLRPRPLPVKGERGQPIPASWAIRVVVPAARVQCMPASLLSLVADRLAAGPNALETLRARRADAGLHPRAVLKYCGPCDGFHVAVEGCGACAPPAHAHPRLPPRGRAVTAARGSPGPFAPADAGVVGPRWAPPPAAAGDGGVGALPPLAVAAAWATVAAATGQPPVAGSPSGSGCGESTPWLYASGAARARCVEWLGA
jgi:hypothetical protein